MLWFGAKCQHVGMRSGPRVCLWLCRLGVYATVICVLMKTCSILCLVTHVDGAMRKVLFEMANVESPSLIGYAILKASFDDQKQNYLDNFEKFVLAAVRRNDGKPVSAESVSDIVRDMFGIVIPGQVVRRIGKRAAKKGLLVKSDDGSFLHLTHKGTNSIPDLEGDIAKYRRMETVLVAKLQKSVRSLCKADSEMDRVDWKKELKRYIEQNSIGIIREWRNSTGDYCGESVEFVLSREERIKYLLSNFVAEIYRDDLELFQSLVNLTQGIMLATLLDSGSEEQMQKLDQLSVALDTPIILDSLGLHGEESRVAAADVLEMLSRFDVCVFVFRETLNEVNRVLSNVEHSLSVLGSVDRPSKVLSRAIEKSWKPSDVVVFRDSIEDRLKDLHIQVRDKPDYVHEFCLDEKVLEDCIKDFIAYKQRPSLVHDVNALSAVHRLRSGAAGTSMERARYLFVTTNGSLVRASEKFALDNHYVYQLAVSFEFLATRLWLRAPGSANNIPKDLLVAAAYAGLRPPEWVWDKVLDNIDECVRDGLIGTRESLSLRLYSDTGDLYMKQIISGEEIQGKQFVVDALTGFVEEKTLPFQAENAKLRKERDQIVESKDKQICTLSARLNEEAVEASKSHAILTDRQNEIDSLSAGNRELEEEVRRLDLESKNSIIDAKVQAYSNVARFVIIVFFVVGLVVLLKFIFEGAQNWRDGIVAALINIPGLVELFCRHMLKSSVISKFIRWVVAR